MDASTRMTEDEWSRKESNLRAAVTRAHTNVKAQRTLAAKLAAIDVRKEAQEALSSHRLNRFSLVYGE